MAAKPQPGGMLMLSRRRMLIGTAGMAVALGAARVAAAEPRKRLIVDSQIHMWPANTPDRPWVPGTRPQLPEPFTIERVVPMIDEAGVDRVVIVPPTLEGERIDYAQEAVRRYPGRFAIMARIALDKPDRAARLALIIDHMGVASAAVQANKVPEAIDQSVALARFPNVSVKLSAAPLFSAEPYPFRDVSLHIRRLFDAYGPRRCYWGTDVTNSYAK